ncbi:hypothetical protein RUND412_002000 [Rhizina undulata]
MEDAESELSRFRQQWKEEVSARQHNRLQAGQSQSHESSSAHPTSPPSKVKAPAFSPPPASRLTKNRTLSYTSANKVEEEEEYGEDVEFHKDTSPIAFRRRLSFATGSSGSSALEQYEKAVEKETEGNLGESLSLYRKAFRHPLIKQMDPKVDTKYKDKYFPRQPYVSSTAGPLSPAVKDHQHQNANPPSTASNTTAPSPKEVSSLIASFVGLKIQPTVSPRMDSSRDGAAEEGVAVQEKTGNQVENYSPLSDLPSELLLQILRSLALMDFASFVRTAQVCKALAYLVATEQHIWRAICENHYSKMMWEWKVTVHGHGINGIQLLEDLASSEEIEDKEEENEKREIPVNEEELAKYSQSGSWKKMFQLRPRIRFNGIYISTCNYQRAGANSATSVSWNTPVHIVTYYRYLRFYQDGTVLSLLSTCEPAEVVHWFNKPSLTPAHLVGLPVGSMSWGKHVLRGRWRMDADGLAEVETEAPQMDRYLFKMALRIRSVRTGGKAGSANKLTWEGFWSWNKLTDDLAEFSLK